MRLEVTKSTHPIELQASSALLRRVASSIRLMAMLMWAKARALCSSTVHVCNCLAPIASEILPRNDTSCSALSLDFLFECSRYSTLGGFDLSAVLIERCGCCRIGPVFRNGTSTTHAGETSKKGRQIIDTDVAPDTRDTSACLRLGLQVQAMVGHATETSDTLGARDSETRFITR